MRKTKMTRHRRHFLRTVSATLAVLVLGALAQAGSVPAFTASASTAAVASVRDEGQLHLMNRSGPVLHEEGAISGTMSGTVRVRFLYNGSPVVTAQFTIYTTEGSIRAHGLGRLSDPNSSTPSFAGPLAITGGTGRYTGAQGRGKLYGVYYADSDKLVLQPVGELHY
jgi:hypothetical protein